MPLFFASALGAFAGTITIDDFSLPNPATTFFINALNSNPFTLVTGLGDGITRTLKVDVQGPSNPISANGFIGTVSVNNGVVNLGTATSGPPTFLTLDYAISPSLNLEILQHFLLSFDFLQVGSGTSSDLDVTVTTTGGTLTGSNRP